MATVFKHQTAWAGRGNGVLVLDADGDGKISRSNEFVFTGMGFFGDAADLEALKHIFDTNGNGKLDAGDAQWSKFRVDVNGQLVTPRQPRHHLDRPDADGQRPDVLRTAPPSLERRTFTRADGTTGAVGDAKLANDDDAQYQDPHARRSQRPTIRSSKTILRLQHRWQPGLPQCEYAPAPMDTSI